jgi:choline dehydrogenase-like flavoprotein
VPTQAAALEAAVACGHERVRDHNRPWAVGAGLGPMNRIDGLRMSTSLTYLAAARGRDNLTIRPDTLVDAVRIEGGRAVGVYVAGSEETIEAHRVVLAAGALGSPSILLRSRIGPRDTLSHLDVPMASEVPGVGEHLVDHVWASVDVPTPAGQPSGPLTSVVVTMRSSRADPAGPPDLHLVPCSAMDVSTDESPTGALFFIGVSVLKPKSRGRLRLKSFYPEDLALVEPGHLTHPDDMARTMEGIAAARELLRSRPLSGLVAGDELGPAPGVAEDDAAGLEAGIRATYGTYYHLAGTCRMGPDPGRGDVVDARGAVYGVEGLYVADASIMPDIPSANTNLPTIMIGEQVAAMLRD